ncbi:LysR family transcriptional regulator [Maridesulfovibrio sp. FT414]|uniref:LysR family transcriptional regulator n=1 Tax=Maridesulfovibrio sp. FT414 TaxID=2979469 RepID=UPI003D80997F
MELYQLKSFAVVADEGNLTRASKRLHTSQPAVSAHIKALEDELGVSLFIRTPKGMVLTADGEKLRSHAERVLNSVAEMEREAGQMRGVLSGILRIGINAEPELLQVAKLFAEMRTYHPDLHIHLIQAMTAEVLDKLESDELDAAFMYGEIESERIFFTELRQLEIVVAGAGHLKAELEAASAVELGNYPWIITPPDCPFYKVSSRFFQFHGFEPQHAALIDDESVIRVMVKNGIGLSLLLRQDAVGGASEEHLAIWDKEALHLQLSIGCLQRRKAEPMLQTLFSILSQIWQPS